MRRRRPGEEGERATFPPAGARGTTGDPRRSPKSAIAAYNVSGEYAMLKAAARNGWLDEERAVLETLTGIKRAGADMIITYHAPDAARWLQAG